jgi:hypothetical protein
MTKKRVDAPLHHHFESRVGASQKLSFVLIIALFMLFNDFEITYCSKKYWLRCTNGTSVDSVTAWKAIVGIQPAEDFAPKQRSIHVQYFEDTRPQHFESDLIILSRFPIRSPGQVAKRIRFGPKLNSLITWKGTLIGITNERKSTTTELRAKCSEGENEPMFGNIESLIELKNSEHDFASSRFQPTRDDRDPASYRGVVESRGRPSGPHPDRISQK